MYPLKEFTFEERGGKTHVVSSTMCPTPDVRAAIIASGMEHGMREGPRPDNVNEYIRKFPRPTGRVLSRVRTLMRKALPGAEETISYGIPAYKIRGRVVVYFAGWKEHYSIYPFNKRLEAAFKDQIAAYDLSGRGTIRFPLDGPVPADLVMGIAKFRAQEVVEKANAKKTVKKRR